MALHRDIYWVGRQWAVTGYGVQACDQKQKGQFDVKASRLWDDDVLENLRAQNWFNVEDFDKALAIARKRFPEPPKNDSPTPPKEVVPPALNGIAIPPLAPLPKLGAAKSAAVEPPPKTAEGVKPESMCAAPVERPRPAAASFQMRVAGSAKFVRPWRLRPKQ
jgi:hypothetical protein